MLCTVKCGIPAIRLEQSYRHPQLFVNRIIDKQFFLVNDYLVRSLKNTSGVACILAVCTSAAFAQVDLHQRFANCTGRLSAQLEHEWLMSDSASEKTAGVLTQFQDLLQAATPEGQHRETLNRRIEAKLSHSALLTRASFNDQADDAERAKRRARKYISLCTAMLIGS